MSVTGGTPADMTQTQRQLCREFASVIDAGGLRLAPIAKRMGISRSLVSMLKSARRAPTTAVSARMLEIITNPVVIPARKKVVARDPR